ncbi:MAG: rhomboid family intramembrane serine protease [Myxococcales bacterium]|nr:rhomboid family intramembrane serine protease [Myxococcales bacterium]
MRLALKPPKRIAPTWVWIGFGLVLGCSFGIIGSAFGILFAGWPPVFGALLGVIAYGVLGYFASPWLHPAVWEPLVVLEGERLWLPRSRYRKVIDGVPLLSVDYIGWGVGKDLLIGTDRRVYRLPVKAFVEPERIPDLIGEYRRALRQLPGGEDHFAQLQLALAAGSTLRSRSSMGTNGLLLLLVMYFLGEAGMGGFSKNLFERALVHLTMGASASGLVWPEPWRIMVSICIHGSYVHGCLTIAVLLVVGQDLERILGTRRVLNIFLWSSLWTPIMEMWGWSATLYTLGATAGCAGLVGAYAVIQVGWWRHLPPDFRKSTFWWSMRLITLLLLCLYSPYVSLVVIVQAGVGGAILGGYYIFQDSKAVEKFDSFSSLWSLGSFSSRQSKIIVNINMFVFGASVVLGVFHWARASIIHQNVLQRVLLPNMTEKQLSVLDNAVEIWHHPDAPQSLKKAADAWLTSASMMDGVEPQILLARSERLEMDEDMGAALALRWQAIQAHGVGALPALADGLAVLDDKPMVLGPASHSSVEIRRLLGDDTIELGMDPPLDKPSNLFLLHVDVSGKILGLLEWPLASKLSGVTTIVPASVQRSLDQGGRLDAVLWVNASISEGVCYHPIHEQAHQSWRRFGELDG